MNTTLRNRTIRSLAKVVVAASALAVTGIPTGSAHAAPGDVPSTPFNTCAEGPCVQSAWVDQRAVTAVFRGETRWPNQRSIWYLSVTKEGVEVANASEPDSPDGRFTADLGVLTPGSAYEFNAHVGTPYGEQRIIQPFTTGPAVAVTPTTTAATFNFSMSRPVNAVMTIRKPDGTNLKTVTSSAATSHSIPTGAILLPSTTYGYEVTATDSLGRKYVTKGYVTTKAVKLVVTVTGLQINDDSDYVGAGELRAQLYVGPSASKWIWSNERSVETAWGPKYFALNVTHTLPNALKNGQTTVPVYVTVSDDDCEGIGSICTSGSGDLGITSGTASDGQWAALKINVTLPAGTVGGVGGTFLKTISGPVGFTVTGTYSWVPV